MKAPPEKKPVKRPVNFLKNISHTISNIAMICIFIMGILSISTLSNCGILAPNTAIITIINDDDNKDDEFIGLTLTDVLVNYDELKKSTIAKGKKKDFPVQWWGENQQDISITYFIQISDMKIYGNTTVSVRNFEHIEKHIRHNNNKSPEVALKK